MNLTYAHLDRWRTLAEHLRQTLFTARQALQTGDRARALPPVAEALEHAIRLNYALDAAGAARPMQASTFPDIPLHLLDTPANRRYLRALQNARDAAAEVDQERQESGVDSVAAEILEMLLADTEMEVHGPVEKG